MANSNLKITVDSKELDRLAIGGRLYDMFKGSDDKINFSTIIEFDRDTGDIFIRESDLLKAIQLVNVGQPSRHIRLIKE